MPLLLAFEPVPDRAARLAALVSAHLAAELVVVTSIAEAQAALAERRPDLVLVSPVLDSAERAALKSTLASDAGLLPGVPTLAIPPLADEAPPVRRKAGLLGRLRRPRVRRGVHACEPAAFAAQITESLALAAAVRRAYADATGDTTVVEPEVTPAVDLQVIVETERADEPAVASGWLDLEPLLDDDARPSSQSAPCVADVSAEPDVIELPPPGELWAQRVPGYAARMAPLEGPSMTPRAAARMRTSPESEAMELPQPAIVPLRPVRDPGAPERPKQDEWGLYDPEQCGFVALLHRLEELADDDRREQERGNRSAIMRR